MIKLYKVINGNSKLRSSEILNFKFLIFNSRKDGFTLIETVMVMVIVAILAAVVLLRNPFDSIKLDSATRKVAEDIRYVQKLSISNQTRSGMTFTGSGYTVYSNITLLTPARSAGDSCSTDSAGNFVVLFTDPRCSSFSNVTIAPNPLTIAFDSLGKPVDAAGADLANQTVTVTYNGNKTITVEAGTGMVSY